MSDGRLTEKLQKHPLQEPAILQDKHGRVVDYVRISVTDRCDFRCVYCMSEKMIFLPRQQLLSLEEIYRLAKAFTELGVTKLRLTGGEPLVRKNILSLIEQIGALPGLDELLLTTNGSQLEKMASALRAAGVSRLNISLDSLKHERFKAMTRTGDLNQVLRGIDAAQAAGFDNIRLNVVILRGRNEDEVMDLLYFAKARGLHISYIEEMPLGEISDHAREDTIFSNDEILQIIGKEFKLIEIPEKTAGPSRYYRLLDTSETVDPEQKVNQYLLGKDIKVGFISPMSHNFCATCNRVRLTVEGRLLLCLGNEHSVDLRELLRNESSSKDDKALKASIIKAMDIKPKQHYFYDADAPQIVRFMNMTGG